jgi:hypothetical protein
VTVYDSAGTIVASRYAAGTSGGPAALADRVHELTVTLEMAESRLRILATGGHMPAESLMTLVLEMQRVLNGRREP